MRHYLDAARHAGGPALSAAGAVMSGRALSSGRACFTAKTRVLTARGWEPIASLREGDLVLSREEQGAAVTVEKIARVYVRGPAEVWRLELVREGGEREVLETTAEHRFGTERRAWVAAGELAAGERVWSADGRWWTVARSEAAGFAAIVYNLEVENSHTYFVEGGVWVHNAYREATRSENGVSVGRTLSFRQALNRVRTGRDVHADTRAEARTLAQSASSPKNRPMEHPPHVEGISAAQAQGRLPHFIPITTSTQWVKTPATPTCSILDLREYQCCVGLRIKVVEVGIAGIQLRVKNE